MDLIQRMSKLTVDQQRLLELKLQKQGFDVYQISISKEYRKKHEQSGYFPLSLEQEPMWVVEKFDPNNPYYEIPGVVMMEGDLNPTLLERCINEVIKRHEILRVIFSLVDNKPAQMILPTLTIPLQRINLKDLPEAQQEKKLKQLREDRNLYMFDLTKGPAIKALLVELGGSKYVFIVIVHHIVGDLLSLKLVLKEAAWFYSVFSQERPPGYDLPILPFQYIDYACWEQRWFRASPLGTGIMKNQEEFWLNMYRGGAPVLNLPIDYPRPLEKQYDGNHIYFTLNEKEIKALKEIFLIENTTLYVTLFAVFYIFLAKISGQEDIVVGTPVNSRNNAALNNMIGLFVKTAALRNSPNGEKTFRDFLNEVNKVILKVYKNQDYQYDQLVRKILKKRNPGRNPLFDVLFNFVYVTVNEINMPGLKVSPYKYKTNRIGFDLELICEGTYKELFLKLSYCTKLFKDETALRFISYIKQIIRSIIEDPNIKIANIDIISEKDKARILHSFNNTRVDNPIENTLQQIFIEQVEKTPERVAIIGTEEKSQENEPLKDKEDKLHLTYRELDRQSNKMTQLLMREGGKPNEIIAIMIERSIEMVIGILGILKTGGAYLPIDPNYPQERIDYILKDSQAKILLTSNQEELNKTITNYTRRVTIHTNVTSSKDELPPGTCSPQHPTHLSNANSPSYIIYTSGSTGRPKGVIIQQRSVVNTLYALNKRYASGKPGIFLLKTAYTFDVSVSELFSWFFCGARLTILEKKREIDPEIIIEVIEKYRVTHINFVPSMFNVLVEVLNHNNINKLNSLRYIFLAGETLLPNAINAFKSLKSHNLLENLYGPTEASIYSSIYPLTDWDDSGSISIGKPIANTEIYILNNYNQLQPIGIAGELCISGTGLAKGYLNNPELTAKRFSLKKQGALLKNRPLTPQNFLLVKDKTTNYQKLLATNNNSILKEKQTSTSDVNNTYLNKKTTSNEKFLVLPFFKKVGRRRLYFTGDLARWLYDGNIEFLGRIDHQVKIRGFRIELGEIEARLLQHDEIREAVVVVRNSDSGDRYLCAYIISTRAFTSLELSAFLAVKLPDYMIPTYFVPLEKFPLTISGKVDRNALPLPQLKQRENNEAPKNEREEKLVQLWAEVLGLEKEVIGVNTNFFQLGGHSLNATILVTKIHKTMDVNLKLTDIFNRPRVRDMAKHINEVAKEIHKPVAPVEDKEYYCLSPAQKRLYILQHMALESTNYNLPYVLSLAQPIDEGKLEAVFKILVARHECLRTSFQLINNEPVQRIHNQLKFNIENSNTKVFAGNPEAIIKSFIRPFDLSKAPLLRVSQKKIDKEVNLLLVDMHHIISDGKSLEIIVKEFIEAYTNDSMPVLPVRYRDYVEWRLKERQQKSLEQQEKFWLEIFKEEIPVLKLPTDWPRSEIQSFEGNHINFEIDIKETRSLKEIARNEEVTLFMLMLSLFTVLLLKLTGQEDIIVGTDVKGRNHADLENVVGMFVNTLALRNFPRGEKTFREFLQDVKKSTLAAFDNQDYPFESLVEKLELTRDPSRNPIFDAMFALQPPNPLFTEEQSIPNLSLRPYEFESGTSKFDLLLVGIEKEEHLFFNLEYSNLFNTGSISSFIGYYKEITSIIIDSNNIKLKEINISHGLLAAKSKMAPIEFGL